MQETQHEIMERFECVRHLLFMFKDIINQGLNSIEYKNMMHSCLDRTMQLLEKNISRLYTLLLEYYPRRKQTLNHYQGYLTSIKHLPYLKKDSHATFLKKAPATTTHQAARENDREQAHSSQFRPYYEDYIKRRKEQSPILSERIEHTEEQSLRFHLKMITQLIEASNNTILIKEKDKLIPHQRRIMTKSAQATLRSKFRQLYHHQTQVKNLIIPYLTALEKKLTSQPMNTQGIPQPMVSNHLPKPTIALTDVIISPVSPLLISPNTGNEWNEVKRIYNQRTRIMPVETVPLPTTSVAPYINSYAP